MKRIISLIFGSVLLTTAVPSAFSASVLFDDTFGTSTTNGVSVPTGGATSYDMVATKNTIGGTIIRPGDFSFKLSASSTSGWIETQALFTNNPVNLVNPGDFIDVSITFTNGAGTNPVSPLWQGGNTSAFWLGLYNSGSAAPVAGGLANSGLTTTPGSAFATGNAAGWKGYVSEIISNGTSRFFTRPQQTAGGTTSANQDLVANNIGSGSFLNPAGSTFGTTPVTPINLTAGAVYTIYYQIAYNGFQNLSFSNAIYAGTSTAGTLIYAQTNNVFATNTLFLTGSFDGFAFGTLAKGSVASLPIMDITEIKITGQVSPPPPPVITVQPQPTLVATNGSLAFQVTTLSVNPVYQWHRNGTNLPPGGNISVTVSPDQSVSTLIITNAGKADAASGANGYWVTVTGAGNQSIISTTNPLTVMPVTNLVWTGGAGSQWDVNTSVNWKDGLGNASAFNYGDPVTFDGSVAGASVTVSNFFLSPVSITESDPNLNDTYTFTGPGSISGPTPFYLTGASLVQLNEANAYTGGTYISNSLAAIKLQVMGGMGNGPIVFGTAIDTANNPFSLEVVSAGGDTVGLNSDVQINANAKIQMDSPGTGALVIFGGLFGTSGNTLSFEPVSLATTNRIRVYGANTACAANLFIDGPSTTEALYNGNLLAFYNPAGIFETYNGVISGHGGLLQKGAGTTVLNGQNTYSGGTFLATGTMGVGADTSGSVTSGPFGTGPIFVVPDVGGANLFSTLYSSGGAHTIANLIQYPSGTNNQTLAIGGTNDLTFSGAVSLNGLDALGSPTNRIINVTNMGVTTISGVISDASAGFGLTLSGSTVLKLTQTETYSGTTIIRGGILAVNGQIGPGAVTVTNGTLAGTGTVTGPVTVITNSFIAPGFNGIGTLALSSDLTLSNGSLSIEVNNSAGQTADKINVTGNLNNFGFGTVTVTNIGPALAANNRFVLFNKAVTGGANLGITGSSVVWSNGLAIDGSITVLSTVVIPLTPTNISFTFNGANSLTLSWPSSYLGWSLQSNSVAINSTTNWFTVPNSSSITQINLTVDPTKNVFYRMFLTQ